MNKESYISFIKEKYDISPDYPFDDANVHVFRHPDTRKWFGIIMTVKACKFASGEAGCVDIVNLKCSQDIILSMIEEEGIYPAYHMSKKHWISVCLSDKVSDKTLKWLTDVSYDLTRKPSKSR